MAYTEKDFEEQQVAFNKIEETFHQIEQLEKEIMKKTGITEEDKNIDFDNLNLEEKKIMEYAKTEALKNASKAQTVVASESKISTRKNIIFA